MPPDLDIPGNDNEGSPSPPPPPRRPLMEAPNEHEFAPIHWRANPGNLRISPLDFERAALELWEEGEVLNIDNHNARRHAIDNAPPRPAHRVLGPARHAAVNRRYQAEERRIAHNPHGVCRRLRESRLMHRDIWQRFDQIEEEARTMSRMLASFLDPPRANPMLLNTPVNGRRNDQEQGVANNRPAQRAAENGNDDNKVVPANGSSQSRSLEQ